MLNLTVYYIIGKVYNTISNPALLHYRFKCYNTIGNPHYYIIGKCYNIIGKLLHYWEFITLLVVTHVAHEGHLVP